MNQPLTDNLLRDLEPRGPEEQISEILTARGLRILRIVSNGDVTPPGEWYDQDTHEWVLLLKGAARVGFDDGRDELEMSPGDHVLIPAHCRHRVEWTATDGPTVWLAVHYEEAGS